jgi:hypothetical protein
MSKIVTVDWQRPNNLRQSQPDFFVYVQSGTICVYYLHSALSTVSSKSDNLAKTTPPPHKTQPNEKRHKKVYYHPVTDADDVRLRTRRLL